jgi:hypothetical protein
MTKKIGILLAAVILNGCASIGPKSVRQSHGLYGQAISTSLNEQFLQNLVRLRYRESPYFLEVGSVTSSMTFESSLGMESALSTSGGSGILGPEVGASYSTSPTISYAPLQGEDFFRKMLVAVPLESLFVLMQSGWSAKRVFGICVERINDLENAPSASGPTPERPPGDTHHFELLLELLDSVRHTESIQSSIDKKTQNLLVKFENNAGNAETLAELKSALGLASDKNEFSVTSNALERDPETLVIRTRSIMSILFYLSQTVDVPSVHKEAGLVVLTQDADGSPFDWRSTPAGKQFRIRQSARRPRSAYLAVPYGDHWFYIANNDLDTKASFMLMSQLFSLNAGAIETVKPTLTIPVGR